MSRHRTPPPVRLPLSLPPAGPRARRRAAALALAAFLLPACTAVPSATPDREPAPSPARARWVGLTSAIVLDPAAGEGVWVAGPFAADGTRGWITDTASGLGAAVDLRWRAPQPGDIATLSAEAGGLLGLAPGAIAHIAVYVAP